MFLDKVLLFQPMFFWCLPGLSLFGALNGENDCKQHKLSFCCDQLCGTTLRCKQNALLASRDKFTIVKTLTILPPCLHCQEYSKLIPGTTVGTLSDDSGNVIQLIEQAYAVRSFWGWKNKWNLWINNVYLICKIYTKTNTWFIPLTWAENSF